MGLFYDDWNGFTGLGVTTLLILVLLVLFLPLVYCGGYDNGHLTKIGQIVQFGEAGVVYRTYEGVLMRGGMAGGTGVIGTAFHFTVPNDRPDLVRAVTSAMESQAEVEIRTKSLALLGGAYSESGGYMLESIKLASPRTPQ